MGYYNVKIIVYDGETDLIFYKKPIAYGLDSDLSYNDKNRSDLKLNSLFQPDDFTYIEIEKKEDENRSMLSSLNRTKNKIYDYARANTWDYFLTFTFDGTLINRYNYDEISKRLSKWLNNVKSRKAKDLKYLIVPEAHESGRLHFHGLLSNTGDLNFFDSGLKTKKKQVIYNLDDYGLGFTTATKVVNSLKASNYITKYITKELVLQQNKKRYWNSKNLKVGKLEKMLLDDVGIELLKNQYFPIKKRYKKVDIDRLDFSNSIEYITI